MSDASWTRRGLIKAAVGGLIASLAGRTQAERTTTQPEPQGYYTLQWRGGRWWFITPEGVPFFSLGLNHIDPASLRYPENGHLWRDRYGNSMERWLRESVAPDLRRWGFNCIGWTQEVVTRGLTNHRHSRRFTREEYRWAGLPYCHQLPFAEFHQWEAETRHPDFASSEFVDWCDHVAREHCAPFADDPMLIGYFYIDCPTWVHVRPQNEWKGPLFDPDRLKTDAGRASLRELAGRWYRTTHDAVRRYDRHHLILGDRYEANAPLPVEVVEAALPYVDVLSFQDFRNPVGHLDEWYQRTGKPVLWADGARGIPAVDDEGGRYLRQDGAWYADQLAGLRENPGCVGAHLCGAYIRNRIRKRGLLGPDETPDQEALTLIAEANRRTVAWVQKTVESEASGRRSP